MARSLPLALVVPALALAAALPAIAIPLLQPPPHDDDARRLSVSALSFAVYADLAAHERAVQTTARRIAAYQARPPELMERTLAELAAGYPAFQRLYIVDTDGKILAGWQQDGNAPPVTTDPSPARRAALKTAPYTYVGVAGAAGAGDRLELAQPIRLAAAEIPTSFVVADLSTQEIAKLLGESEDRHGVTLSLTSQGGRTIYPPSGAPAGDNGGWQGDAGYGLTLRVKFAAAPRRARVTAASGGAALGGFAIAAIVLGLIARRRPRGILTAGT